MCVCVQISFSMCVCEMQSGAGQRGRQTWSGSAYHMIGVLKTVRRRSGLNIQLEVKYSVTAVFPVPSMVPSDVTFRRHIKSLKLALHFLNVS